MLPTDITGKNTKIYSNLPQKYLQLKIKTLKAQQTGCGSGTDAAQVQSKIHPPATPSI